MFCQPDGQFCYSDANLECRHRQTEEEKSPNYGRLFIAKVLPPVSVLLGYRSAASILIP
jgi:hypothetical protein